MLLCTELRVYLVVVLCTVLCVYLVVVLCTVLYCVYLIVLLCIILCVYLVVVLGNVLCVYLVVVLCTWLESQSGLLAPVFPLLLLLSAMVKLNLPWLVGSCPFLFQ